MTTSNAARKRHYRLRKKAASGRASAAEQAEIDAWTPRKRGRPPKAAAEADGAKTGEERAAPPPPPPPPPPTDTGQATGERKAGGRYSRDEVCRGLATAYCAMLERVSDWVTAQGAEPVFSRDMIRDIVYPAAAATADNILPAQLVGTPEAIVLASSTLVVGQAAVIAIRKRRAPRRGQEPAPAPPAADPSADPDQPGRPSESSMVAASRNGIRPEQVF